jgi:hypothetical protein
MSTPIDIVIYITSRAFFYVWDLQLRLNIFFFLYFTKSQNAVHTVFDPKCSMEKNERRTK